MNKPSGNNIFDPARRLTLLLYLVGVHSVAVGLGMIWQPVNLLEAMGCAPVGEPFFPAQGGVFHIVMAMGYVLAARDLANHRSLIRFAILVKSVATGFLLIYWMAVDPITVVLASGIGDGIMAVLLFVGYKTWLETLPGEAQMDEKLPGMVVTGASGFVGRHFLASAGGRYRLFCLARRSRQEAAIPDIRTCAGPRWMWPAGTRCVTVSDASRITVAPNMCFIWPDTTISITWKTRNTNGRMSWAPATF